MSDVSNNHHKVCTLTVVQQTFPALADDDHDPNRGNSAQRSEDDPVQLLHNLVPFALGQALVDCCALSQPDEQDEEHRPEAQEFSHVCVVVDVRDGIAVCGDAGEDHD